MCLACCHFFCSFCSESGYFFSERFNLFCRLSFDLNPLFNFCPGFCFSFDSGLSLCFSPRFHLSSGCSFGLNLRLGFGFSFSFSFSLFPGFGLDPFPANTRRVQRPMFIPTYPAYRCKFLSKGWICLCNNFGKWLLFILIHLVLFLAATGMERLMPRSAFLTYRRNFRSGNVVTNGPNRLR